MNPSSPDVTPHDPAAPLVDVNRTGGEPAEGIGENGGWTRSTRLAESLLSAGAGYHDREYLLARCGCALRFSHLFRPEHLALVRHAERIADGDVPPSPPAAGETDLLTEL